MSSGRTEEAKELIKKAARINKHNVPEFLLEKVFSIAGCRTVPAWYKVFYSDCLHNSLTYIVSLHSVVCIKSFPLLLITDPRKGIWEKCWQISAFPGARAEELFSDNNIRMVAQFFFVKTQANHFRQKLINNLWQIIILAILPSFYSQGFRCSSFTPPSHWIWQISAWMSSWRSSCSDLVKYQPTLFASGF